MSQTIINERVVYNPTSKIRSVTYTIPICEYWNEDSATQAGALLQRENILSIYGQEVIQNGGEITISQNGDIVLSFQSDELYDCLTVDVETDNSIDWYFHNVSLAEYNQMAPIEWDAYKNRIWQNVIRRYLSQDDLNSGYQDLKDAIKKVDSTKAKVVTTVEATLQDQMFMFTLTGKLNDNTRSDSVLQKYIKSDMIKGLLKKIKIRQMSVSAFVSPLHQLFGFVRNIQPFAYMKGGLIYSLCSDEKISTISSLNKEVSIDNNQMYKGISTQNKKLMCVCQQNDTEFYLYPAGLDKIWVYSDNIVSHQIPEESEDPVNKAIQKTMDRYGSYIEVTLDVNNEQSVEDFARQITGSEDTSYMFSGIKTYKSLTSKSRYMIEYGVTIPISQTQIHNSEIMKIKSGIQWGCMFLFIDNTKFTSDYEYFGQSGSISQLVNCVTGAVYAHENQATQGQAAQPILTNSSFIHSVEKTDVESQNKQQYYYDETYINDYFLRGEFLFMTKTKNTNSAGQVKYEATIKVKIPNSVEYTYVDGKKKIFVNGSYRNVTMHTIFNVHDINDTHQIKDTINQTRYQMMNQLYGLLSYQVSHEMKFGSSIPKNFLKNSQFKQVCFWCALFDSMTYLKYGDEKKMIDQYLGTPTSAIYHPIIRTFEITNESYSVFHDADQIVETNFAYELRTFNEGKQDQQSYSNSVNVTYTPMNVPVDMRILSKELTSGDVDVYFNILVPNISSDQQQGGGLIAKQQQAVRNMDFLKYIVAKSKEYNSALSNSESVRQNISSFDSTDIDSYLQDKLPIIRKSIDINLTKISTSIPTSTEYDLFYLNNDLIGQMVYEYNHITQIENMKIGVNLYNLEDEASKYITRVEGNVVDDDGNLINNVIISEDISDVVTRTDMNGNYTLIDFNSIPTTKNIIANKTSYTQKSKSVTISDNINSASLSPMTISESSTTENYKTTIIGAVYDSDSYSALKDVTYSVINLHGDNSIGYTDEDGMYKFELDDILNPDTAEQTTYTITFTKENYVTSNKTFKMIPNGTATIYVLLVKE